MGTAIDRSRDGELDAFDVHQVLLQYSREAKELFKFCDLGETELSASIVREQPKLDWWERGNPRKH